MERSDDESLNDDALLLRRREPAWIVREDGRLRPGSNSLRDERSGEVSFFVFSLTNVEELMSQRPNQSLISFRAGLPRQAPFKGIVAKTPEDPNPAHRVLCYRSESDMKKAAKFICDPRNFEWVILREPGSTG